MSAGSHGGGGGGAGGGFSLGGIAAIGGLILVLAVGAKNLNLHSNNAFGQTMATAEAIQQGPVTMYPGKEFQIPGIPGYCMNGALNGDKLVVLNKEPSKKIYIFKLKLRPEVKEATPVTFVLYKNHTNGCVL